MIKTSSAKTACICAICIASCYVLPGIAVHLIILPILVTALMKARIIYNRCTPRWDAACGTGVLFPDYLKQSVESVSVIDVSSEMAKIAALARAVKPGGHLSVAHSMSRSQLRQNHAGRCGKASIDLIHESVLNELMLEGGI